VAKSKTFETPSGDHIFLLAAITAALAAIFLVTVWAPLQVRAFAQATQGAQPEASAVIGGWSHVPFATADGNTTSLEASSGQVRVVTMMYTHCPGMCPLAVSTLQDMEARLTSKQRSKVSIIALSLDPERDSLARLREFRAARGIDSRHWIVARPSVEGARQLANAMGVDYRVLGDETIDHQSVFVLLGKSGEVLARSSNTRSVDPEFFSALQAASSAN
jgi:protein SCO1/2